ncbi:ATP-binding cassette domain-containing protein [Micromonospora sp. D93]|nr:ATP-binding cassette domain-containing protein [Micromonospora sp. D93]
MVDARALEVSFGSRRAVAGVDLQFHRGILGLLGPNGAGKTTLLRILTTVITPSAGELRLFGRPVDSADALREARRRTGFLPQTFGYHPGFTVYEFVRYCAWLREVPSDVIDDATRSAIDDVGLTDRSDERMKKLSGGMIRRCGIAQAIVGNPPLVVLDEPTTGLDPDQRLDFRDLLEKLSANSSVILSTHLVEDVAAVCDRVVVMKHGRPLYVGTPDELAELGTANQRGGSRIERGYATVVKNAKGAR